MAGNKYLKHSNGRTVEEASIQSSAGAGDAGKIPALDTAGRLDNSMMPVGIGADTSTVVAGENLSAGDLVNIYDNSGTPTARKADATTSGKEACGFVLTAVTSGNNASVYHEGSITGLSGLTAGRYYLSTTAGGVTATPPSAAGNVVQFVGIATSSSTISFEATDGIILA